MNKPIHVIRPLELNPIEQDIDLPSGQRLELRVDGDDSIVSINAADTNVLSIRITREGAKLIFEDSINLCTKGDVSFDGGRVTFRAREELRLESEGEISIYAKGDVHTEGRIQNIRAKQGNVNIKANDDVKLRAERILLNN